MLVETCHDSMEESIKFLQYIFSRERIDQVVALTTGDDANIFLPRQHIFERVLPQACLGTLSMFVLFAIFYYVTRSVKDQAQRYKLAYRLTNIVVTAALGVIGMYGEFYVLPQLDDVVATYIQGLEEHILIVNLMFGFQLWAMVVGGLLVKEDIVMMGHHTAVFLVAIMYATFTNGFRYHMFYFAGVWEISSIPLAIMNILRDHPQWKNRLPGVFLAVRMTFAISFLILRIWIGTRRAIRYVTDLFVVFTTTLDKAILYRVFMFVMFSMSFFLAILQFYWAGLIAVMIVRKTSETIAHQMKKLKVA